MTCCKLQGESNIVLLLNRLIWKLEGMLSFGKQQQSHMMEVVKAVPENQYTLRALKYKVCYKAPINLNFMVNISANEFVQSP